MKKIITGAIFLTAAFGLAACGGVTGTNAVVNGNRVANNTAVVVNGNTNTYTNSGNTNSMNGNMSGASSALSDSDKKFMMDAAQGGMAEVKLGELAEKNGASADVKAFGKKMVEDHSNANTELKAVAAKKNLTLPTDVNSEQKEMYDKLAKMSGADFDKAYVKGMVEDHEKDVADFKKQADSGNDSDAKAFAAKVLPVITGHLEMIKGMQGKMK